MRWRIRVRSKNRLLWYVQAGCGRRRAARQWSNTLNKAGVFTQNTVSRGAVRRVASFCRNTPQCAAIYRIIPHTGTLADANRTLDNARSHAVPQRTASGVNGPSASLSLRTQPKTTEKVVKSINKKTIGSDDTVTGTAGSESWRRKRLHLSRTDCWDKIVHTKLTEARQHRLSQNPRKFM